jgi:hypothetical protein
MWVESRVATKADIKGGGGGYIEKYKKKPRKLRKKTAPVDQALFFSLHTPSGKTP